MLCLSRPCIIIIRKLATRPLYNLFPSRTGPMKQGLCSVVLEEAQRLSDAFRLLEGYLCLPVVNLLTLPANDLSMAVSGSKLSTEGPSPPIPSENYPRCLVGVSFSSLYPVHA